MKTGGLDSRRLHSLKRESIITYNSSRVFSLLIRDFETFQTDSILPETQTLYKRGARGELTLWLYWYFSPESQATFSFASVCILYLVELDKKQASNFPI